MPQGGDRPPTPLSARLATVGALLLGLVGGLVVGPQLFPSAPGQGFNVARMLVAGAGGAVGAALGWVVGRLIEGPPRGRD